MTCPTLPFLCFLLQYVTLNLNHQSQQDLTSDRRLISGSKYDFIIVGAGPAGCLLANRLSASGEFNVLLLEAGGEEPFLASVPAYTPYSQNSRLTTKWTVEADPRFCGGEPCPFDGGFGLGGGSLHNEMVYNRGNKEIFNTWQNLGNPGWSYEDVLPYFKKWENNRDPKIAKDAKYHSSDGPQSVGTYPYQDITVTPFIEGFKELKYKQVDINGDDQLGVMNAQFFQNFGQRQSANKAFLAPIRYRNNLKIVTNVRVIKILIDPVNKRALGVEYGSEKTKKIIGKVYANKEVIVSCGAISSPQLLMLSGIGPKNVLEPLGIPVIADLPVGKGLQNHNRVDINLLFKDGRGTMPKHADQVRADLFQYMYNRTGPMASEGPFAVTAYLHSSLLNPKTDIPDIQFLFGPTHTYGGKSVPDNFSVPHCYYDSIRCVVYHVRPRSRGFVSIDSKNPFSSPVIQAFNYTAVDDYTVLVDGSKFLYDKFLKTQGVKKLGVYVDETPAPKCNNFKFGSTEYWYCFVKHYTRPARHYASTCKMGKPTDPTTVVNSLLRVHGFKNLRVIDASIMPVIVNGNMEATILMTAEKGADIILKKYLNKY